MSEMIERAAKAMCSEWGYNPEHVPEDDQTVAPDGDEVTYCPRPSLKQFREASAAALSAALDPEDESLVEAIARATSLCGRDWDAPFDFDAAPDYAQDVKRDEARAAISALKARLTPPQ